MTDIEQLYKEFTAYPDLDLHYEEINASIPQYTIKKQYFQVYVDLFRNLRRKPTPDEFSKKINEMETLSNSLSSLKLNKGGKRRTLRKSKRIRKKKSKRIRRTKRRKYF